MSIRDRDSQGRPHNARPRDGLGRPLPRGARGGVPGIDEDLVLTPSEALSKAQTLLDEGSPFHAHEVLEGAWKTATGPERDLWQGLAQLAVGLTHLHRGNRRGGRRLLERGAANISAYAAQPPHNVDVAGLRDWAADVAASHDAPDDLAAPRLCRSHPR